MEANPNILLTDLSGMHRELAELVGVENMLKLCKTYGGAQLRIPTLSSVTHKVRNRDIVAMRLAGHRVVDIAEKYELNHKTVTEILRKGGIKYAYPGSDRLL